MLVLDPNLIFDIGLHKGGDAGFYLKKGFSVVGLEASPSLVSHVRDKHPAELAAGTLVVLERALYTTGGQQVSFYVNPAKDDWGSLTRGNAEKGMSNAELITVETTTLHDMVEEYGLPYYMKCDIEGADTIFVEQLRSLEALPTFVSVEATRPEDIATLLSCGYDRFQLVNQYLHPFTRCPSPAREGAYVDARFNHETSGLFGKELPPEKWTSFGPTMAMFQDWYSLRSREQTLAVGWLDIHACKQAALQR